MLAAWSREGACPVKVTQPWEAETPHRPAHLRTLWLGILGVPALTWLTPPPRGASPRRGRSRAAPPHTGAARARCFQASAPPRPPGIWIRPGRGGAALLKGPCHSWALVPKASPPLDTATYNSVSESSQEGFRPFQLSFLRDSGLPGSDRGWGLQSHLRPGWTSAGQITGCSSCRTAQGQ